MSNSHRRRRWLRGSLLALAGMAMPSFASASDLIQPLELIVDRSLPKTVLDAQVLAGRRYDTFWNTGDEALARAALAQAFRDNTLPAGRPQGIAGVLKASKAFRMAVPDLRCQVSQMIVAGDRVVTHLHFTGPVSYTHLCAIGVRR